MPPKYSDNELDELTEAERQALLDESTNEEGADGDGDQAADVAKTPETKPAEKEADDKSAAPAAGDQENAPANGASDQQQPASPPPPAAPPPPPAAKEKSAAEFDADIKALRDQQDRLAVQFDNGELTAVEFQRQSRTIDDQVADARESRLKLTLRSEDAQDTWYNKTVPAWFASHPEYADPDSLRFRLLNSVVTDMQTQALAEGRTQYDTAIMDQALAQIQRDLGISVPAKAAGVGGQQREVVPRDDSANPPNLSGLPSAPVDDGGTNARWSHLERLSRQDPEAYEAAMAKLTPADQDAYLSWAG